jgi:hypothetical protein
LSKLAAGLLSVQVSISPRPLPSEEKRLGESEWSGMSGAPVVAAGRLLGVVTEHAPREGQAAITAVPLTALEFDPGHRGWGRGSRTRPRGGPGWASPASQTCSGCRLPPRAAEARLLGDDARVRADGSLPGPRSGPCSGSAGTE